jgi:hypothetical protein
MTAESPRIAAEQAVTSTDVLLGRYTVAGADVELQMTKDGPAVGRHVAKIYDSPLATGRIAVIPDDAVSAASQRYQVPDVASHTSYWTVANDARSGTINAWLWQGPYQPPAGGDLHVYGRWSC